MAYSRENLQELFEKYEEFVKSNAQTISRVEAAARMLAYLAPGFT